MNIKLELVTNENGYNDFDVIGHDFIKRVCVPLEPKKGETFNAYLHTPESSKYSIIFNKNVLNSIKDFKPE